MRLINTAVYADYTMPFVHANILHMLPKRPQHRSHLVHTLYLIGIAIKGVDGLIETFGGLLFLLTGTLSSLIPFIGPYLAVYFQLFTGAYLLGHGLIKIVLVYALLKRKHWAYKFSLVVLSLFLIYQIVSILASFSIFLFIFTVIDAAIIVLVWEEYKELKLEHKI